VGQFLSAEPLLEQNPDRLLERPQLLSAYSYAASNPLRYTDPDGFDIIIAYGRDKNKPRLTATYKQAAERLSAQIKANNPDVRVKLVDIGKTVKVKAAGGKKVTLTPAQLLAQAAKEITDANRKVSALAVVSHGSDTGQILSGTGQYSDFDEAVKEAQVQKGGAAVALACRVAQGVRKDTFRKSNIGLYASTEFFQWETVDKARKGYVTTSPKRKVNWSQVGKSAVKPGDFVLPNLVAPIKLGGDPLAEDPNIAQVLVDADKRISTKK
jgi:hypothetical protein